MANWRTGLGKLERGSYASIDTSACRSAPANSQKVELHPKLAASAKHPQCTSTANAHHLSHVNAHRRRHITANSLTTRLKKLIVAHSYQAVLPHVDGGAPRSQRSSALSSGFAQTPHNITTLFKIESWRQTERPWMTSTCSMPITTMCYQRM